MAAGMTIRAQLLAQDDRIAMLLKDLGDARREIRDLRGAAMWYRQRPGGGPWERLDEEGREVWRLMADRFAT